MEGNILKRFHYPVVLGALMFLLISSPSFSQMPAPYAYSVQRIEVTERQTGSRVAIEGSKSFEYTVFRVTDPLRVVIDLPGAQLGKLTGPVDVRNGTINVIQNRQIEDPQPRGARIEIGLDQLVEYDVNAEGNSLYINFGKPAIPLPQEVKAVGKREEKKEAQPAGPLRKAKSLRGLDISAKVDWMEVSLNADGPIPDYKSFQLARPTRLIVDLPQMINASAKKNIDVGSQLLKDIHIGQHPDKVRLVFTFPKAKLPPYQLSREGTQLKLILGEVKKELPRREQAPVIEPPKPAQVAAVEPKAVSKEKEAVAPAPPAEKPAVQEEKMPSKEAKPPEPEKAVPTGAYKGTKISLDFKDADIHNIFRLIAEVSSLNIITSEEVKGKITIRLVNVPWDQALDVILATKNLIKIEEGNVLRITTIETLRKEREERQKEEEISLKTRDTKLKLEEPGTRLIRLSYSNAVEIMRIVMGLMPVGVPGMPAVGITPGAPGAPRGFLSPQGSVRADTRTNTLIVQDIRANLEEIEALVRQLDTPTPQVLIEARVVQAVTTFARSLGIQWGGSYNQTNGGNWAWGLTGNNPSAAAGWGFTPNQAGGSASTNLIMPSNFVVNFPAATANTPAGGLGISFGKLTGNLVNLDLRLQMGETNGQTRVIARPKIATLTNKEAHIKQGEKIPYETTSQAGTQVQFIDAVLQLKVTPLVTPDGSILMKVLVTRDARGSFRSPVNQVPSIDNREVSTEVLVKDGETLVIGGIYETDSEETTQGIPWLMKIPVLGWLFKNQERVITKKELLIFINPTIIVKAKAEV